MAPEDVIEIVGQPEGLRLEYKAKLPPPDLVAAIVAGFANAEGGWLVLGVVEDPQGGPPVVAGISPDAPAGAVVEGALARLRPPPAVQHGFVEVGGKPLYVVAVPKAPGPVTTLGGRTYERLGDRVLLRGLGPERREPRAGAPQVLLALHELLGQEGLSGTTSKVAYIEQIQALAMLASNMASDLMTEGADNPSRHPHGRALTRLLYSSVVDSWERYLIDVLIEVHLADPRTLVSERQFKADDILSCTSMPEVYRLMAEQKVGELSRGGVKDFAKYLERTTGLSPFIKDEDPIVQKFYAVRHLFTHSNGAIDRKFIRVFGDHTLALGEEYAASLRDFCVVAESMTNTVSRLDANLKTKFGLSSAAGLAEPAVEQAAAADEAGASRRPHR